MPKDYYETLEVSIHATADEIKTSYRRLAKTFHPDLNGGSKFAEEKFKEIHEAYLHISDASKRRAYDQQMRYGSPSSSRVRSSGFGSRAGFGSRTRGFTRRASGQPRNPNSENEKYFASKPVPPIWLDDFIGQERIVNNLRIFLAAARKRGEAMPHVLVMGESGYGKSTLAFALANEIRSTSKLITPSDVPKVQALVGLLTRVKDHEVLVVESFELLKPSLADYLMPALSVFEIPVLIGERRIQVRLRPFTLIAVINDKSRFKAKYQPYFGINCKLEPYPESNMIKLILKAAESLQLLINYEVATLLATSAEGNPRAAFHLLKRVRDFSEIYSDGKMNVEITSFALKSMGLL